MKKFKKSKLNFLVNRNRKKAIKKVKRDRNFRIKKRKESSELFLNRHPNYKPLRGRLQKSLFADEEFKLLVNTQEVIAYISELKSHKKLSREIGTINIDLSLVKSIDIGAISLLLSSIKELNIYGINIIGNLPNDKYCRDFIVKSGYLDHMSNVSKNLQYQIKSFESKNLILMSGGDKSESKKVGECLKKSIEVLTGIASHYPPIYGMIQEMNGNSVEHAYRKNKHWILGVNHDKDKGKIIFTFTDNGFGILQTLKRRFSKKIFDSINLKTDEAILNGVFDKEYNSRFKKQYNRNKGLPVIKKAQVNNKIKNLLIITNNVFLQIADDFSFKLDNSFSGTFYYWELDIDTYNNGFNKN